jgi:pyrroline-5-carboxylate reductase
MEIRKVAILGGGNIGVSIAKGLLKSGIVPASQIHVTRRRVNMIEHLRELGLTIGSDNLLAVKDADIIFMTVKPAQAPDLMKEIREHIDPAGQIMISIVTGLSSKEIHQSLSETLTVFLAMPNTAIALGESMTCLAPVNADAKQEEAVVEFLNTMGKTILITEDLIGASTVLAACGIAFALRFLRAISQGGIEIGFGSELSTLIAAQTLKGASELILQSGHHPEREIDKVTTPQGITISGLNEMEHNGFSSALIKGLLASFNKIDKLREKGSRK